MSFPFINQFSIYFPKVFITFFPLLNFYHGKKPNIPMNHFKFIYQFFLTFSYHYKFNVHTVWEPITVNPAHSNQGINIPCVNLQYIPCQVNPCSPKVLYPQFILLSVIFNFSLPVIMLIPSAYPYFQSEKKATNKSQQSYTY